MHDYLPALRAVFFSVFDDLQGLKLLYEVPGGCDSEFLFVWLKRGQLEGACSLPLDEGASLFDLASEYMYVVSVHQIRRIADQSLHYIAYRKKAFADT